MLVGENGSGKSTLAKVAAGLFQPDVGSVVWDDDREVAPLDLRPSVTVLFQDIVRYQMSARDNITIARAGETDEPSVRDAAHRASVAAVVDALPHGFDTMLASSSPREQSCREANGSGWLWPAGSTETFRWRSWMSPPRRSTRGPSGTCTETCAPFSTAVAPVDLSPLLLAPLSPTTSMSWSRGG